MSRWRTGGMPSLPAMRSVADALGVSMLDVLLVAGIVDKKEVGRDAAASPAIPAPEIAIQHDATLSDWQRKHVLDFLRSLREVAAQSEAERAKPRGRKGR